MKRAAAKVPKAPSKLEATFDLHIRAFRLAPPVHEYRFHPTRRWRFDRAWPELKLAVEIEGLTPPWKKAGRHQRPKGYSRDCTKYNEAQLLGWTILRFTRDQILCGAAPGGAIRTLGAALARLSGGVR